MASTGECLLRLHLQDQALTLQVSDDGKGIPDDHRIGVGWLSMRERAVELGGRWSITRGPSGGTTIQVSFPLGGAGDSSSTSVPGKAQQE